MDRKDIYEHLAKIYLDASSKKKKKARPHHVFFKNPFFIAGLTALSVAGFLLVRHNHEKLSNSEISLVISPDPVKINFHFDPARKEIYSVNLNKLNLTSYKVLGFSIKKANYGDNIALRIEFVNQFNEKSEVYLKGIPNKWQDYKIVFSDFKNITNWSRMSNLSFIVEEWNTDKKRGVVYVDNVRFLK